MDQLKQFVINNFANFISIILSGLLSWIITVFYFRKGNKHEASAFVVEPIKRILEKGICKENQLKLNDLSKVYSFRYLPKKKRDCISNLIDAYASVSEHNQKEIDAQSILEHYFNTLKEKNIKTDICPVCDNEGEIVFYEVPSELELYMYTDIVGLFGKYPIDIIDDNDMETTLNKILNSYTNRYLAKDISINFFEGTSLSIILKESTITKKGEETLKNFENSKNTFLKMLKEGGEES